MNHGLAHSVLNHIDFIELLATIVSRLGPKDRNCAKLRDDLVKNLEMLTPDRGSGVNLVKR